MTGVGRRVAGCACHVVWTMLLLYNIRPESPGCACNIGRRREAYLVAPSRYPSLLSDGVIVDWCADPRPYKVKFAATKAGGRHFPSFVRDAGIARCLAEAALHVSIAPAGYTRTPGSLDAHFTHPSPYTPQPRYRIGRHTRNPRLASLTAPAIRRIHRRSLHTDQRSRDHHGPSRCRSTFFHAHLQSPTTHATTPGPSRPRLPLPRTPSSLASDNII
jgi:hypothetical protein